LSARISPIRCRSLSVVAAKDRNEVDAALEVIGLIDLKGRIVTADALHCNRKMVEAIIEKGGDYCIALKGNQDALQSDARDCLAKSKMKHPVAMTETSGYGRLETRVGMVVEAKGLAECHEFPGLKAFGRIEATRVIDGRTESDIRIFVLSRRLSPETLSKAVTKTIGGRGIGPRFVRIFAVESNRSPRGELGLSAGVIWSTLGTPVSDATVATASRNA